MVSVFCFVIYQSPSHVPDHQFDDSQYKKEIQSLSSQLQELRNENERLRAELKEKDSIIKQVRQLVK